MIAKREFNPEVSAFSNLLLDLQDFKQRVRPLARNVAKLDASRKYQRIPVSELEAAHDEFVKELRTLRGESKIPAAAESAQESVEEGYSSKEIAAESD